MGDQIGSMVEGSLSYVPRDEFERIRSLPLDSVTSASLFADLCRINSLYMIARAGSGHVGTSFSSIDIIAWIELFELVQSRKDNNDEITKFFFSSKGHDAPAFYSAWIGLGKLDFSFLNKLRILGGLPGHPDVSIPNVVTNTGSLGMGVSKAKGIIEAQRLKGKDCRVFVLTGDGELQEGQFWESLISAANNNMHELVVIIDHNKLQSDSFVSKVSDLGDLKAKLEAFGWFVARCDGNDIAQFSRTLSEIDRHKVPKVIIADTIKGKGVSFIEHTAMKPNDDMYKFHSGAPSTDEYENALKELVVKANRKLNSANQEELILHSAEGQSCKSMGKQNLIHAYSRALVKQASKNSDVVAMDADLILDTGLIPFKKNFPSRLIECGIAEQDMVSQAGGLALQGFIPVVHSFSCFLSSRPHEQIYNNATERTKIIYVGTLAGLLPGGPGHSHQAIRDISSLSSIPNLTIIEPSNEKELDELLEWAIQVNQGSTYIRIVSIPTEKIESPKSKSEIIKGHGFVLEDGEVFGIIAYGPIMVEISMRVQMYFKNNYGLSFKVVNMPWLNFVDLNWLEAESKNIKDWFTLDNHLTVGGVGEKFSVGFNKINFNGGIHNFGVEDIPACGRNDEVLDFHQLSFEKIVDQIESIVGL
jgi:transketolase